MNWPLLSPQVFHLKKSKPLVIHIRLNGPEQPHLGPPHAFPQPRGSIFSPAGTIASFLWGCAVGGPVLSLVTCPPCWGSPGYALQPCLGLWGHQGSPSPVWYGSGMLGLCAPSLWALWVTIVSMVFSYPLWNRRGWGKIATEETSFNSKAGIGSKQAKAARLSPQELRDAGLGLCKY